MPAPTLEALRARIGEEVGVSGWLAMDQERVDAFAAVTEDRQFIHVDAAAAGSTPLGGTVAHGFLTVAVLPHMALQAMLFPADIKMMINYGIDRLRFLNPVRCGKRVRGRFVLAGVEERNPGQWLVRHQVTVEIEDEQRPALVADWLGLLIV